MIIKFNPWNKGDVPEIKFLGPERQVQVFRNKISNNLTGWDSNNDIIDEILKLLGKIINIFLNVFKTY